MATPLSVPIEVQGGLLAESSRKPPYFIELVTLTISKERYTPLHPCVVSGRGGSGGACGLLRRQNV